MPEIVFDKLSKRFSDVTVIDGISAVVPDKEFLVLVGPSGCGKSTMLRMIAGLTKVSSGSVRFDGRAMESVEPRARDIAFVFQSYALYPHLTVRANIAFPLVMRLFRWWYHIPGLSAVMRRALSNNPEIRAKVESVAEMLRLTPLLNRRPGQLSGGQRQRVAVARALVREPSVYLLDEPLSNLDAALRTQMRAEIMALHRNVGKTFIYVTHDQVEAMTMGTRIIVLDRGVVQQYGTPTEIYERPANVFVARFIGVPPMNLLTPRALTRDSIVLFGNTEVPLPETDRAGLAGHPEIIVGLRPEMIQVSALDHHQSTELTGTVIGVEYLGAESIVSFRLGTAEAEPNSIVLEEEAVLHARTTDQDLLPGSRCSVRLDLSKASYFDRKTGKRIETRIQIPLNQPSGVFERPRVGAAESF
jgi:multiple sugar transport system ATP-binding protein